MLAKISYSRYFLTAKERELDSEILKLLLYIQFEETTLISSEKDQSTTNSNTIKTLENL